MPISSTEHSVPVIVVSATLKNSHAQPLAGRGFTVESDANPGSRALTDASGALSLRLNPNARYILRPLARNVDASEEPFLIIEVDADGAAAVAESRRIYASNFKSASLATESESSAKFQSARFGESVFAP